MTEGPPSGEHPSTDEFGRDDPEAVEREQRRRERQRRRDAQAEPGAQVDAGDPSRGAERGSISSPRSSPGPRVEGAPGRARASDPAPKRDPGSRGPQEPTRATPDPATPDPATPAPAKADATTPAVGRRRFRARRGRPPGEPRSYRRRRIVALAGTLIAVLLLWFLVALFQPFASSGRGHGVVSVTIPKGASASEVADLLDKDGVISNGTLFEIRLRLAGKTGSILPGSYTLAGGMSYGAAIDRLTGSTAGQLRLLIPEGLSRPLVATLASKVGVTGSYLAASTAVPGFNPARYGAKNAANLEGFLFPATYQLDQGAPAQELVQKQLAGFQQNFSRVNMSYAQKKKLTPYDVLIVASMIEREVQLPSQQKLVAAVIYNRLAARMPLGIDATTRFATGNYDQPLTAQQLASKSPYNTRNRAGLPPGPIGNPGLAAIQAAASPAPVPYRYFVVKPGTCGELAFQTTQAEFNAAAARYKAARSAAGGNAPTKCP